MLLKKAGMVVLGTAAGVAALSGTAFAGDDPGHSGGDHSHSWDRDHGDHGHRGHHHDHNTVSFSDDDNNATAANGDQTNTGDQLVGINNTNLQAPISAVLSILGTNTL